MPLEHSDLTGDQLHEPKGVEVAAAGQVYVADGVGSGAWENVLDSINNRNQYAMEQRFDDLATAGSIYFNAPFKSEINRLNIILYGVVDADTLITIYLNGVLFADSLTVVAAGSAAGQVKSLSVTTPHTINANTVIQITSDGAATGSVRGEVQLVLEAVS